MTDQPKPEQATHSSLEDYPIMEGDRVSIEELEALAVRLPRLSGLLERTRSLLASGVPVVVVRDGEAFYMLFEVVEN